MHIRPKTPLHGPQLIGVKRHLPREVENKQDEETKDNKAETGEYIFDDIVGF